jgi:hypothetical protein
VRSFLIVALLVVASVALYPTSAEACTCVGSGQACEATWNSGAVFRARVVSITPQPESQSGMVRSRSVRLRVLEAFLGVDVAEIDVDTASDEGACGYGFEVGRDYVVYAYKNGERLWTGICTRTRTVEEAEEDLAYLRTIDSAARAGGEIVGVVRHAEEYRESRPPVNEPVGGARVTIKSDTVTAESVSDERGQFTVRGLPAGTYSIAAEAPDGFYALVYPGTPLGVPGSGQVVLRDVRGCASVIVSVRYDGRVSGRILDASGSPVPHVFVQAVRVEEADRPGVHDTRFQTDETGRFEIARLPEGRFFVGLHVKSAMEGQGLPRVMLPGTDSMADARVVSLTGGERIVVPDLTLPESLAFVTLRGVAIGRDGLPATDASVYLHLPDRRGVMLGAAVPVSDTGEFTFAVLPGERYKIHATLRRAEPGPPERTEAEFLITPGSEPPVVRLVFK